MTGGGLEHLEVCPACGALPCDWTEKPLTDANAATAREAKLVAQVERLTVDGIHTCHGQCQRPACVLRREKTALVAQVEALTAQNERLRAALTAPSGAMEPKP